MLLYLRAILLAIGSMPVSKRVQGGDLCHNGITHLLVGTFIGYPGIQALPAQLWLSVSLTYLTVLHVMSGQFAANVFYS